MGGKKKAAPAKKGKKEQEPDETTEKLFRLYRKKCNEISAPISQKLNEKFAECRDEGGDLNEIHLWEEIGWSGLRALSDALKEINYVHVRSIRLWKNNAEDEGVRAVCQFLEKNKTVTILEFMDNKVTYLGCEFIARVLEPHIESGLTVLKLDHNNIGSRGAINLAKGLSMNSTLTSLSLSYCNIEADGARGLFEIVIYTKSGLKELNIQGNYLRNDGIVELLKGLSISKSLEEVNLSDNQFGESHEVVEALKHSFIKNKNLMHYNLLYNAIKDKGAMELINVLKEEARHVVIELSERLDKAVFEELQAVLKVNGKKKKKKGKGKKGKKGKKKKKK